MRRRSFLRAAASIIPAAGLHDFLARRATAQSPASAASGTPQIVGSGSGPIHPTAFSSLLFRVSGSQTDGGLFVVEHSHLLPGGPPLHLHLNQEEWFYVEEGAVDFQVGEQRLRLRAGESVLAPRRVPHTFSAVAGTPGRMLIAFCPAGKMEQFFLDTEGTKLGTDPAFYRKYELEYLGPSPLWQS